jgi:hypothetical protein
VVEADEPCVAVILGGARLAGRPFADVGVRRGSSLYHCGQDRVLSIRQADGQDAFEDRVVALVAAARDVDLVDPDRSAGRSAQRSLDPLASAGQGLVGVRHVHDGDALLEPA